MVTMTRRGLLAGIGLIGAAVLSGCQKAEDDGSAPITGASEPPV